MNILIQTWPWPQIRLRVASWIPRSRCQSRNPCRMGNLALATLADRRESRTVPSAPRLEPVSILVQAGIHQCWRTKTHHSGTAGGRAERDLPPGGNGILPRTRPQQTQTAPHDHLAGHGKAGTPRNHPPLPSDLLQTIRSGSAMHAEGFTPSASAARLARASRTHPADSIRAARRAKSSGRSTRPSSAAGITTRRLNGLLFTRR